MEENKIQEAEIESLTEKAEDGSQNDLISEKRKKKSQKKDLYVELILFLILGFLVGVAIKTEAAKKVTIGFDDYKMKIFQRGYDINKLQVEEALKQAEESQKQTDQNQASGDASQQPSATEGTCTPQ